MSDDDLMVDALSAAHRRQDQRAERRGGWPLEGGPYDGDVVPDEKAPEDYLVVTPHVSRLYWPAPTELTEPAPSLGRYVFEEWSPRDCSRYVWQG